MAISKFTGPRNSVTEATGHETQFINNIVVTMGSSLIQRIPLANNDENDVRKEYVLKFLKEMNDNESNIVYFNHLPRYLWDIDAVIRHLEPIDPPSTAPGTATVGGSDKVFLLGRWRKVVVQKRSRYVRVQGELIKLKDAIKLDKAHNSQKAKAKSDNTLRDKKKTKTKDDAKAKNKEKTTPISLNQKPKPTQMGSPSKSKPKHKPTSQRS
jgi:hypothetical protein